MWVQTQTPVQGFQQFFLISLGYDTLANFYKTNFSMVQHHKYALSDLDYMIPWERHLYLSLLKDHLKEEKDRLKDLERAKAQRR